jgi:serpin B
MISPLGIFHILSLTANGAANKTMVEMLQLLGHKNKIDLNKVNTTLSSIISSFKTVKMANAIFTKFKPEQVFLSLTEKYNSTVDNLISAEQVNSWCSKATNNTITKIIDDINNALMILINAIYFKGNWEKKFDEK